MLGARQIGSLALDYSLAEPLLGSIHASSQAHCAPCISFARVRINRQLAHPFDRDILLLRRFSRPLARAHRPGRGFGLPQIATFSWRLDNGDCSCVKRSSAARSTKRHQAQSKDFLSAGRTISRPTSGRRRPCAEPSHRLQFFPKRVGSMDAQSWSGPRISTGRQCTSPELVPDVSLHPQIFLRRERRG